ncbi:putative membrane protein, partial [Escherichia coli PA24]
MNLKFIFLFLLLSSSFLLCCLFCLFRFFAFF